MFDIDTATTATNTEILVALAQTVQLAAAYRKSGLVQMALSLEQTQMEDLIQAATERGLDETHLDAFAAATTGDLDRTVQGLRG